MRFGIGIGLYICFLFLFIVILERKVVANFMSRNEISKRRIMPMSHHVQSSYFQPETLQYKGKYYNNDPAGILNRNFDHHYNYEIRQNLREGLFYRRNSIPFQKKPPKINHKTVEQNIQDLTTWINNRLGDQGLGFGTNGTGGLIGDVNKVINDVGQVLIDIIQFKLKFLQHVLDRTRWFFTPLSLLEKLENFAAKTEEIAAFKFGPIYGDFTRNFHVCMRKSIQCQFLPILSKLCLTHCALSSIPDATPMRIFVDFASQVLEKFLQILCNPIHTIFHLSWKFYMTHMAPGLMTSLLDNISSMGLNMEELIGEQVEIWAPRTMTRILTPLRAAFNPLDFLLDGIETRILPLVKKFNPACWALDVKFAPVQFMELFDYKPRMIDTLMGGIILTSTLIQGLPGSERIRAKEVYKFLDIMTGLNCGVIGWSKTNGSAICEQRAAIVKKGR